VPATRDDKSVARHAEAARYATSQPPVTGTDPRSSHPGLPPEASQICDNDGTHKTPAIRSWLAKHPRFHMHFTPTGSSWINQVERWFGFLTDQKICRGTHNSVHALEADIRSWIADWNSDPRPFIWTKTAEEILE
jgi:transposase